MLFLLKRHCILKVAFFFQLVPAIECYFTMDVRRQFLLRLEKQLQYTLQSGQIRKQQKLGLAFHLDGRAPERVIMGALRSASTIRAIRKPLVLSFSQQGLIQQKHISESRGNV